MPWSTRLAFGSGHILNDLTSNMSHIYLLLFMKKVLLFDSFYSGLVVITGEFVDAIATVIFGYLSDKDLNFWICRR